MAVPNRDLMVRDLADARLWHASHHRSLERRARAAGRSRARGGTATLAVVATAGAALAPAAALAAPASGGSVVAAQRALGVDADGVVGPQTRAAIRRFQRAHGLPATGRLDSATEQALGGGAASGAGGDTSDAASARSAPSSSGHFTLQDAQQALGVTADGQMGPETRGAVRNFQSAHGLPATGKLDNDTRDALKAQGAATPRSVASGSTDPSQTSAADPSSTSQAPAPASGIQAAIDSARAQIGKPYSSGGRGPAGFDCSGLTKYAFRAAGITLGASSFAQYGQGTSVSKGQIQPGDLVFFNTNGPGASHVGIATSATTMISATSHGVMENSFTSGYWGSHYVGARRVTQ